MITICQRASCIFPDGLSSAVHAFPAPEQLCALGAAASLLTSRTSGQTGTGAAARRQGRLSCGAGGCGGAGAARAPLLRPSFPCGWGTSACNLASLSRLQLPKDAAAAAAVSMPQLQSGSMHVAFTPLQEARPTHMHHTALPVSSFTTLVGTGAGPVVCQDAAAGRAGAGGSGRRRHPHRAGPLREGVQSVAGEHPGKGPAPLRCHHSACTRVPHGARAPFSMTVAFLISSIWRSFLDWCPEIFDWRPEILDWSPEIKLSSPWTPCVLTGVQGGPSSRPSALTCHTCARMSPCYPIPSLFFRSTLA